jgi:hypothetical protein
VNTPACGLAGECADCRTDGDSVAAALRDWGLDRDALTHVILTHWHPDHAGSAAEISAWPNVKVWAHRTDAPIIRGETYGSFPRLTHAEEGLYSQISGSIPDAAPSRVDQPPGLADCLPSRAQSMVDKGAEIHAPIVAASCWLAGAPSQSIIVALNVRSSS